MKISQQNATISDLCATVSKHEMTISEHDVTMSKLSGQVFMLCKLQAVIASIDIMSEFCGLSRDDHKPPTHAKDTDLKGLQLRNMLTTVLGIPKCDHDKTIELIDALWFYRHKVAHPANASSNTIDDLVDVLKENKKALDEKELLALQILEERDLIMKAPRYPRKKSQKKTAALTLSPPLQVKPKAQQLSRQSGLKDLRATVRPSC